MRIRARRSAAIADAVGEHKPNEPGNEWRVQCGAARNEEACKAWGCIRATASSSGRSIGTLNGVRADRQQRRHSRDDRRCWLNGLGADPELRGTRLVRSLLCE